MLLAIYRCFYIVQDILKFCTLCLQMLIPGGCLQVFLIIHNKGLHQFAVTFFSLSNILLVSLLLYLRIISSLHYSPHAFIFTILYNIFIALLSIQKFKSDVRRCQNKRNTNFLPEGKPFNTRDGTKSCSSIESQCHQGELAFE